MGPRRKLALRRELLAELENDQLRGVAGGTHLHTGCGCATHGESCDHCTPFTIPVNTRYCSRNVCSVVEC